MYRLPKDPHLFRQQVKRSKKQWLACYCVCIVRTIVLELLRRHMPRVYSFVCKNLLPEAAARIELIRLAAHGDYIAFFALEGMYHRSIFVLAFQILNNKKEAKKVVPEVFDALWNHRDLLLDIADFEDFLKSFTVTYIFDKRCIEIEEE